MLLRVNGNNYPRLTWIKGHSRLVHVNHFLLGDPKLLQANHIAAQALWGLNEEKAGTVGREGRF